MSPRERWASAQNTYRNTLKGKFNQIKHNAKNRGIPWRLTMDQFARFWKQPCWYCGFEIRTIALDRVVSSRGYEIGNVRSACKYCNGGKSDLSTARFLALCSNVVRKHGLVYARV